jgi:hypothetical protein
MTALTLCVAALPASLLAPYGPPLLAVSARLLEAPSTPPSSLAPLCALLEAALPALPLPALGQSFGDLADLLCGWALEPALPEDGRCPCARRSCGWSHARLAGHASTTSARPSGSAVLPCVARLPLAQVAHLHTAARAAAAVA